jgi:hypothetical protein
VAGHKGAAVLIRALSRYEADLQPRHANAREELCDLLGLDPATAATKLLAAVRTLPAFVPLLDSGNGQSLASSFKEQPYPK